MRLRIFAAILVGISLQYVGCKGIGSSSKDVPSSTVPNLTAWLNSNPTIRDAIKFEDVSSDYLFPVGTLVENSWSDWDNADKLALSEAFERAWIWLYETADPYNNLGVDEFTMPMTCSVCVTNLGAAPTSPALTLISEGQGKVIYFAQVAHALAVEIGGAVEWSILSETPEVLFHYFNSRSFMYRYGSYFVVGGPNFEVDAREKFVGESTPATPRWIFAWLAREEILKPTRTETINAMLEWSRTNLSHFYNSNTYENMEDHWLYPSKAPVASVLAGTNSRSYGQGNWTAGCHGTAGLFKTVLRAINIPVEPIFTCGHAQLYFPSEDKYLDHGDNPYNGIVKASPRPASDLLLSPSTYTSWFSATPDFLDPANPNCLNIGRTAVEF